MSGCGHLTAVVLGQSVFHANHCVTFLAVIASDSGQFLSTTVDRTFSSRLALAFSVQISPTISGFFVLLPDYVRRLVLVVYGTEAQRANQHSPISSRLVGAALDCRDHTRREGNRAACSKGQSSAGLYQRNVPSS
eukprot:GHVS01010257.1.p1 GENE.GHVS01010257.1~~GHVS01010257.1.p1  ORF type:complete len:135 (+),score=9.49 GHVS01010257.1:664-1068(+)